MWVDATGVSHTVASPRWEAVISLDDRDRDLAISPGDVELIDALLDELEEETYGEIALLGFDPAVEATFEGVSPAQLELPPLVANGDRADWRTSLIAHLAAQPLRWRLDYMEAIRDWLGEQ